MTAGDLAGLNLTRDPLDLASSVALVLDQTNSEVLFEKNANVALPIASITKLMTGLIVVEAQQDMDEMLTVTDDDVDREKFTTSRLRVGARMTRAQPAAYRADEFGKPRRLRAGPQLSGRHRTASSPR